MEISAKPVPNFVDLSLSVCLVDVDRRVGVEGRAVLGQERLQGIPSPQTMRNRVIKDCIAKSPVVDLVIVFWISPSPKATVRVGVEDRRMLRVSSIEGPVPVRESPLETALLAQSPLELVDVVSVPWKEQANAIHETRCIITE